MKMRLHAKLVKGLLLSVVALLMVAVTVPQVSAGKYGVLLEKIVMKKEEAKRLPLVTSLQVALPAAVTKFEAKLAGANETEKAALQVKIDIVNELVAALPGIKNKLTGTTTTTDNISSSNITDNSSSDTVNDNTQADSGEAKEHRSYNKNGKYYLATMVQDYIKANDGFDYAAREARKKQYYDDYIAQGATHEYAESAAKFQAGSAPLSVEKGSYTLDLVIDNKKTIKGQWCIMKQQWTSPGVKGDMKDECEDKLNHVGIDYAYDYWLSNVIGYDVYFDNSTLHPDQVDHYVVDYKDGIIVSIIYGGRMSRKSEYDYVKTDIVASSLEVAKDFDKDSYDKLALEWNKKATAAKDKEYAAQAAANEAAQELPKKGTLTTPGATQAIKDWATKWNWTNTINYGYFTSNGWSTIRNYLGIKVGERANGVAVMTRPDTNKCAFQHIVFRRDDASSPVFVEGVSSLHYFSCDKKGTE